MQSPETIAHSPRVETKDFVERRMSAPTFTVIVPTYNQRDYLGACLDSILAQTDPDWEAVVINDGSTDGTAELADDYARRDARIRVFHQVNGGVASALNEGLKQARGRWINWLSSDDLFDARKLETNRRAISEFPECKFFFSYFRLLRESTQELTDHGLWGPLPDRELQIPTLFFRNYISGITICIERDAWRSVGQFDVALRYAQDFDMWLRLLSRFPARFIPEWTVTNRNHALQGSEIFAEACYYDTAKAAILFLNRTSFAGLFPLLDLADHAQAERALECAINMAGESSAFLYALGWQPALLCRTLQWIFETEQSDEAFGRRLRTKARWLCRQTSRKAEPDHALVWKAVQSVLAIDGLRTQYKTIDPVALALNRHAHLAAIANPGARSIADYLKKFHNLSVPDVPPAAKAGKSIAIVIDSKVPFDTVPAIVQSLLEELTRRGWYVAVFMEGEPTVRFDSDMLVVTAPLPAITRAARAFRYRCVLTSDIVGARFPKDCLVLPLNGVAHLETFANIVVSLSGLLSSSARTHADSGTQIPLVFLTRSLHGGGAEKVLYDLVHSLDQQMFDITIIPLFEAAHAPVFTKGHVTESYEVVSRRIVELPTAVIPVVPLQTSQLPAIAVRLASKLRPGQLEKIKSAPFFPVARYVLRSITSGYRGIRYGRPNRDMSQPTIALQSEAVEQVAEPHYPFTLPPDYGIPDVQEEQSTQFNFLRHYRRMSQFVSRIIGRMSDRAIVVSVMEEATIVAWMASMQVPFRYIAWLHTVESLYLKQLFPDEKDRHNHDLLLHTAVARAESCIFPSQGCCDDLMLLYGLPGHHFKTIYNPVDLSAITALAARPPERPLDLDPAIPVIVSLGRLSPEKGQGDLLKALRLLRQRHPKFLCLIIGAGETSDDIADMIREYDLMDHVRLHGPATNPFPYLAKADTLVLTSKFEAFALVLVEAMALGVSAISVDCPTGPREVLDHGRAGVLVPPDHVDALADAIEKVLWLGTDTEIVRGYASDWVKTFDISAVSLQWRQLLEGIDAEDGRSNASAPYPGTGSGAVL